ncbi:MAG: alanine--tRNA ligase-related protein [Candidatus Colwellbacteria bacterium]|nr:alanine--tRNA ligase-related protein [Candidatus Colwellbacteria bacterium]
MVSEEIRKKFLDFFIHRDHKLVGSYSLVPSDPSVLLTSAGMQQFKAYYTDGVDADKDFGSRNVVSVQKCFRTSDIDEVGDETHLTFFEMLGNFSFGGYFKKEAIKLAHEFITQTLGLKIDYVTIFGGDEDVPEDEESREIWRAIDPGMKVIGAGRKDNFWGPTGSEGPCGPTTEIYVNGVEVWNLVFNEFYLRPDGKLERLESPGVDTGCGLERLTAVMDGSGHIFETDIFGETVEKIKELKPDLEEKVVRIFADHLRACCFLIADGIRPANKEAGYILRRLIRKLIAYELKFDFHTSSLTEVPAIIVRKFQDIYPELDENQITEVLDEERTKFKTAISRGLKELADCQRLTAAEAFHLYETYGLPFDLIKEMAPSDLGQNLSYKDFENEFGKHQEVSRAGVERKFGGHGLLLDTGELKATDEQELRRVTRLHTATHLMQAALKKVLGDKIEQRGSDITTERTRFDFLFDRKLTDDEIRQVEDLVNDVIQRDLPVNFEEMPLEQAKETGALYFFKGKYPPVVKVYYVGSSIKNAFSKELCGGPHAERTGEMGKFRIRQQKAVAEGVRRIKADLEEL